MTRAFVVVGLAAFSIAGGLPGQQTPFRAGADVVEVYATVKLKDGTIAHDLTREDFELRDDGKPREIAVFSRSIQPLSVALVLDHSGSTGQNFDTVRLAAQDFVSRLLRTDRASIRTLTWDCLGFTEDRFALVRTLRGYLPPDDGSPIWSATDAAVSSLAAETGRRIIVLMSDGQDVQGLPGSTRSAPMESPCQLATAGEARSAGDVIKRVERDGVMVYTVGVEQAVIAGHSGLGDLVSLAERSGAEYRRLKSYDQLRVAFQRIADELHLQYLLGFVPAAFDGKRHEIDVKAKRPGVTVLARKTYVATRAGG
jgi:Ca-activated chloride channel family protein